MFKAVKWVWSLVKKVIENDLQSHAAEMAYFAMMAVFPFLLLLTAGIAFLEIPDLFDRTMAEVRAIAPPDTVTLIEDTVREVTTEKKTALAVSTMLLSIWMSVGAMGATTRGLNRAFGRRNPRTYFGFLGVSLTMTLVLGVLLITSILVLMLGPVAWSLVRSQVDLGPTWEILFRVFRIVVPVFFLFIAHAGIYWLCPAIERRFRIFTPGTAFSVLSWIVVSIGFQVWLSHSNNYDKLYGGLGVVILTLVWFYLMALVLLIGGQIDAMLHPELKVRVNDDGEPVAAPFPWRFILIFAAVVALGVVVIKTQVDSGSFTPTPTSIGGDLAAKIAAARTGGTKRFDHSELSRFLAGVVNDAGLVDYTAARADRARLDEYLDRAAKADVAELTTDALHAFLINVHNAAAIRLALDLGADRGARSLAEMPDAYTRVVIHLDGTPLSLGDLEDRLLRHEFSDPRHHFVLNDASVGAAPLARAAYTGDTLDAALDAAARRILADVPRTGDRVKLPGFIQRYGDDFRAAGEGSIAKFIAPFTAPGTRELLEERGDDAIVFEPLDRSLNAVGPDGRERR